MRLLLIGTEPDTAEKVNLAARLRWPDAAVHVAAEADNGLEVSEDLQPDMVILRAGSKAC